MLDDGASRLSRFSPGGGKRKDAQTTHLPHPSISCLCFPRYIQTTVKSVQCTWQRVQLRLVSTWESHTRSMSKQIRWGGAQTSSLWAVSRTASAADDNVNQPGWSHSRNTQTLHSSSLSASVQPVKGDTCLHTRHHG